MNCAACGKPGIVAIANPAGGFICVRCVQSGKVVPGSAGQPTRVEIQRKPDFWRRLVINLPPEQMEGDELVKLANVLSDTLMLVEAEITKREAEESDAEQTEDVPSTAALDAPEEKEERSGPVLFNPSVAADQEGDSQA